MFPELDAFVKGTAARYGLELIVYTGGFVEGLADLVAKRPGCALVMGTRSTDPNGACARAGCWLTQLLQLLPLVRLLSSAVVVASSSD